MLNNFFKKKAKNVIISNMILLIFNIYNMINGMTRL